MLTKNHRFVGAAIRANNRTYGLRPAQEMGPEETVTEVDNYDSSIKTAEGNFYFNGGYTIMRMPSKEACP